MAVRITPQGPQSYDPLEEFKSQFKPTSQTKSCPEGYVWDESQSKCVKIAKPTTTPAKSTKSEINETGAFRTATGNLSGIALKGGRTFLGLDPDEVRLVQEQEQRKLREKLKIYTQLIDMRVEINTLKNNLSRK